MWSAVVGIWILLLVGGLVLWYARDLPDIDRLAKATRNASVTLAASDGSTLAHYGDLYGKSLTVKEMSPWLPRAVITSEDQRFCYHNGVDWVELQGVVEDAFDDDEAPVRGASTISMQTAKNLFLWDGRFFIRKILEMPVAFWMDTVWTKRRMIEVYLNIVEWAPGVYGAEAAAQHHFHKPARNLTRREAALLAAVLPNPIKRKAGKPSRRVNILAH
ncbi:MAG TPA: monofunctional biosynthetic peptidoglycan transglycosylase, partial [Aestuariivirga sp.]|nr:monofunctional biosynthetic peptidoglycan transglycosylase [Aestuariivirga sp.]